MTCSMKDLFRMFLKTLRQSDFLAVTIHYTSSTKDKAKELKNKIIETMQGYCKEVAIREEDDGESPITLTIRCVKQ